MSSSIVQVHKFECIVCKTVYYSEFLDEDTPLGFYLDAMFHHENGGGPVETFIDMACLSTPLNDIIAAVMHREQEKADMERDRARFDEIEPQPKTKAKAAAKPRKTSRGRAWTDEEKAAVMNAPKTKAGTKAVARKLKRSESAIVSQRWKMEKAEQ
jgi:hypothetical protein